MTSLLAQLPHREFLTAIARLISPFDVLEIGTREGESLMALLVPSVNRVAVCDTWGNHHGGTGRGSHEHIRQQLEDRDYTGEVIWLDGPSSEMVPTVAGSKFSITHVDADHSTEGCKADLNLCWPLTECVMIVHDIFMPSVWIAVSDFLSKHTSEISAVSMSTADSGTIAIWRNS